jgi:ribonuclease P protein component
VLPNELSCCRLGLAVSRKIGNAVVRNKVKRRLREIFRRQLRDRPLHYDFVVVARSASAEADFREMQTGMISIFSRLGNNEDTVNSDNQTV